MLGVLEQGGVEGGFRAATAVAKDDVADHVLPSDMGWRGGVTLQPSPMATVDHRLSDQETWRKKERKKKDVSVSFTTSFFPMTKTRRNCLH